MVFETPARQAAKLNNIIALVLFGLLLRLIFFTDSPACAEESSEDLTSRVVSVQGTVEVKRAGEDHWVNVKFYDTICAGDTIRVLGNSRAALLMPNETVVRLDQNTSATLKSNEDKKPGIVEIIHGTILFFTRSPSGFKVLTPFVNAYSGGTEFEVKVENAHTIVSVLDGKVKVANAAGSILVRKGESALIREAQTPVSETTVRPYDAVQWALYYPPLPERDPALFLPDFEGIIRAKELYNQGLASQALSALPSDVEHPAFYNFRALLLLSVGRTDEAAKDLARSLELDPQNSYAFSLRSIMAVVQNRKDEALDLAQKAKSLDPTSSAALIALSYAYQARFDLDNALSALEQAVVVAPDEALGWARLSELWLSKGYSDRAADVARNAVRLNPSVALAKTVLGFAYLTQIRLDEAKKSFNKAIRIDSTAPLPRLGLGLALIREGNLEAGRKEIEIAVSLDPLNSLIRSYLGKAYYEEKRDSLAGEQLGLAKELDPIDPTPWFYDAIRKQTTNRPVEALADLQKSVELNDNRAVYRSTLLLDEDLAARSASLARIYDDLGFDWLALIEGCKSLSIDPANFSAHRFLADVYFSQPLYDIARVSELLQAQLLQPINILPIQPQLAESRSYFLNSSGPVSPSYNEYTPLFTRDQLSLLLGGIAGQHDTLADEVVQSGILGRFSYSLGQFHSESNGIRVNNDQSDNIYDAFAQVALSPSTNVQAEYRHTDSNTGDLVMYFDPAFFDAHQRETDAREFFRLGLHQSFGPGSDFIGSFMYLKLHDNFSMSVFDVDNDRDGFSIEVQHLYRSDHFSLVGGAGGLSETQQEVLKVFGASVPTEGDVQHENFYLYSLLHYPQSVVWTLGFSADFFEGGYFKLDDKQVNPKFGVTWTPFPGTTFRGALFRTFERTLLTDQTIEPTQIAGFNQFFEDGEGTDAWRYGLGIDQKLAQNLFAGVECSRRELNIPTKYIYPPFPVITGRGEETLARTYLYWTPHPWFALGPEYQFELTHYDPSIPIWNISRLETHRVALAGGFYHPSGFFARIKPSFVAQNGDFRALVLGPTQPGDSTFFVLDASVGYRLPKRSGIIQLEARNLFDRSFRFQDTDPMNPQIIPSRSIVLRWMLSF